MTPFMNKYKKDSYFKVMVGGDLNRKQNVFQPSINTNLIHIYFESKVRPSQTSKDKSSCAVFNVLEPRYCALARHKPIYKPVILPLHPPSKNNVKHT